MKRKKIKKSEKAKVVKKFKRIVKTETDSNFKKNLPKRSKLKKQAKLAIKKYKGIVRYAQRDKSVSKVKKTGKKQALKTKVKSPDILKKKKKVAKIAKNVKKLIDFNKLRSKIWKKIKDKFENYSETASYASYLIKKVKGRITYAKIEKRFRYFKLSEAMKKRYEDERIKLIKEIDNYKEIRSLLIYDFDYYDLADKIQEIKEALKDKDIRIKSDLSKIPEFMISGYKYSETFKDFTDILNGDKDLKSGDVLVKIEIKKDEKGYYLDVFFKDETHYDLLKGEKLIGRVVSPEAREKKEKQLKIEQKVRDKIQLTIKEKELLRSDIKKEMDFINKQYEDIKAERKYLAQMAVEYNREKNKPMYFTTKEEIQLLDEELSKFRGMKIRLRNKIKDYEI